MQYDWDLCDSLSTLSTNGGDHLSWRCPKAEKSHCQGCHSQGKVREKQKIFKVREKSEFCKRSGKIILEVCKSQ